MERSGTISTKYLYKVDMATCIVVILILCLFVNKSVCKDIDFTLYQNKGDASINFANELEKSVKYYESKSYIDGNNKILAVLQALQKKDWAKISTDDIEKIIGDLSSIKTYKSYKNSFVLERLAFALELEGLKEKNLMLEKQISGNENKQNTAIYTIIGIVLIIFICVYFFLQFRKTEASILKKNTQKGTINQQNSVEIELRKALEKANDTIKYLQDKVSDLNEELTKSE